MNNSKSVEAVNRVPNERLEDLVREAILEKMNDPDCKMKFQEFDIDVRKDVDQSVFVDITVYGYAGDTTKDEFAIANKNGKVTVVKGGGSIKLTLDDDSVVQFVFSEVVNLNATEYRIIYRLS